MSMMKMVKQMVKRVLKMALQCCVGQSLLTWVLVRAASEVDRTTEREFADGASVLRQVHEGHRAAWGDGQVLPLRAGL